ncbi:hypothetical protein DRE_06426 [Drechslerella stenobrocha 248]|uniref:Uncharacterized protein n=1 Tax=Drechslerella stenobrocha 248 TaxID=1043628 RepID=W7HXX9_9PEZI|nr:hypothetical protein DRE_06426 [Drechslerella stenobrocha 248]
MSSRPRPDQYECSSGEENENTEAIVIISSRKTARPRSRTHAGLAGPAVEREQTPTMAPGRPAPRTQSGLPTTGGPPSDEVRRPAVNSSYISTYTSFPPYESGCAPTSPADNDNAATTTTDGDLGTTYEGTPELSFTGDDSESTTTEDVIDPSDEMVEAARNLLLFRYSDLPEPRRVALVDELMGEYNAQLATAAGARGYPAKSGLVPGREPVVESSHRLAPEVTSL